MRKPTDHASPTCRRIRPHAGGAARAWIALLAAGLLGSAPARLEAQSSRPSGDAREPISGRRIIKHFDFNERPFNNDTTVPQAWRPVRTEGFPLYLEGRFDEQTGRASPPSFRFDLNGGSLAYQYEGNDIAVRPNSDYLVVAWVKSSGLETSRAYLSAFFLDRKGERIPGTERTTAMIGGSGKQTAWEPIQIGLVGNVQGARYIGLRLWLTQQRVWDTEPAGLRHVEHEDVRATAWFDDLTVYRLPRIALWTASPGNVFVDNSPVVLFPEVTDPDGLNLVARLRIRSADGQFTDERQVPIRADESEPHRVVYDRLPPGLYNVDLVASTHDVPLVWRNLRFARIPEPFGSPQSAGRGFGVVLQDINSKAVQGQHDLLGHVRPEWVKLPVWYPQRAVLGRTYETTQAVDGYLQAIVDAGADPVGIQMDDPAQLAGGAARGLRPMLDLLSETPLAWKPLIAGTWSRYTGLIHVWQLGQDSDEQFYLDHRLGTLLQSLRREMSTVMSDPRLATPFSMRYAPANGPVGDYRSVVLPPQVRIEDIAQHLGPIMGTGASKTWVTVKPAADAGYPREVRLSNYSRRLIETYFQLPGAVFVPAPWEVQSELVATQVSPTEEYLVLRTLADVLGDAVPVCRTTIEGQAQCLVFDRNGQAILFAWDDYAPPKGRDFLMFLGENAEQIDLWGGRHPIETVGNRQRIRIGPTPTMIVNTPTWLVEFRRNVVVAPAMMEATFSSEVRQIVFKNTYREPINGLLRVVGPENWDVRPTRMTFALQPGQEFRQNLEIRFPVNAEAGIKALLGEFSLDADKRYQLAVPAWFELGLKDIDLETYAFRKGPDAVVRVSMANRTSEAVSFDGDLIIPGRQRMSRLFQDIMPGQSVTKEFTLDRAAELSGRRVRVHFNERQGNRVWNRIVTIP